MNSLILLDAQATPTLFHWNGAVDAAAIKSWLKDRGWSVPPDLLHFWEVTGGGTVYETERLLAPIRFAPSGVDEIFELTTWLQRRGLPAGLVVFHEGMGFTAVRHSDAAYVSLDSDGQVIGESFDFNHWYTSVIRAEYAARYNLPRL